MSTLWTWSDRSHFPPTGPPDLNNTVERTAIENDQVEIDVGIGVESFPFPQEFQWKRDGVPVMNSSRISYGYTSVVFQSVQREDGGNYTLSATNYRLDDEDQQVGSDTGSFFLNVLCKWFVVNKDYMMTP